MRRALPGLILARHSHAVAVSSPAPSRKSVIAAAKEKRLEPGMPDSSRYATTLRANTPKTSINSSRSAVGCDLSLTVRQHNDLGADADAIVEIDDVRILQPDTPAGNVLADR